MMMFFLINRKQLVVSVDTYIDGIHFIDFKKPDLVIKKVIRSSISDLNLQRCKTKILFYFRIW